jgi:hypothetical protein
MEIEKNQRFATQIRKIEERIERKRREDLIVISNSST